MPRENPCPISSSPHARRSLLRDLVFYLESLDGLERDLVDMASENASPIRSTPFGEIWDEEFDLSRVYDDMEWFTYEMSCKVRVNAVTKWRGWERVVVEPYMFVVECIDDEDEERCVFEFSVREVEEAMASQRH